MFCFRTTYNNLNTTKKSTELVFMLPLIKLMKSGLEVLELSSASESPAGLLNRLLGPNRRV